MLLLLLQGSLVTLTVRVVGDFVLFFIFLFFAQQLCSNSCYSVTVATVTAVTAIAIRYLDC